MKKIFLIAFGFFAFAVMFSFQTENNNIVPNSAFANYNCCPEQGSICHFQDITFYNRNTCKSTELEIAP